MSDEHADQLARLRAEVDQVTANTEELAKVIGAYYHALLMQGMDVRDVLELTRDWQAHLLSLKSAEGEE